jgi:hypothetical protein
MIAAGERALSLVHRELPVPRRAGSTSMFLPDDPVLSGLLYIFLCHRRDAR